MKIKKNSRIISACAAALLTVAPLAAPFVTQVSTVNAETVNATDGVDKDKTGDEITVTPGANDDITNQNVALNLDVTNAATLRDGANVAQVKVNLSSSIGQAKLLAGAKVYIVKASDKITDAASAEKAAVKSLKVGTQYKAVATNVGVSGLTSSTDYNVALGTADSTKKETSDFGNLDNLGVLVGSNFALPDPSISGTPYFTNAGGDKVIQSAKMNLAKNSVSEIVNDIKNNVAAHGGDSKNTAYPNADLASDVKAQLESQGVTVDNAGNFTPKTKDFTINYTVTFANGKSITLPITFTAQDFDESADAPVISIADDKLVSGENGNYTWKNDVEQDSDFDPKDIAKAFKAQKSKDDKDSVDIKVDADNFSTTIPGTYTVGLTATNDGHTTRANVQVTVKAKASDSAADKNDSDKDSDTNKNDSDKNDNASDKNDSNKNESEDKSDKDDSSNKDEDSNNTVTPVNMTVQYEKDGEIPVYKKVNGKMVKSGLRVKNGAILATFGQETVDGVSYTMIVNNRGSMYVQTKYLDGSYQQEKTTVKAVMHAAYIYDKTGKRANKTVIGAYSKLAVKGDKTKIGKADFYKIAENRYVKAGNLDGTKRPLKHNAYVYNNKGKAITLKKTVKKTVKKHGKKVTQKVHPKALIKKGTDITTFGSRFKIKGKEFYRVGKNQYIKVNNFGKPVTTKAAETALANASTVSGLNSGTTVTPTTGSNTSASSANATAGTAANTAASNGNVATN